MITLEEAKLLFAKGVYVAGMEKTPDFIIATRVDDGSKKNAIVVNSIRTLINNNLSVRDYSKKILNHIIITYILLPEYDGKGVNWKERKYYKRSENEYFLNLRIPDYESFCNANPETALKIIAEQTLRGIKLFLSKEKDFDFTKFNNDVEKLFKDNGML